MLVVVEVVTIPPVQLVLAGVEVVELAVGRDRMASQEQLILVLVVVVGIMVLIMAGQVVQE
jgi:hypothetical protein